MSNDAYITHVTSTNGRSYFWVRFLKGSNEKQHHAAQKAFYYEAGIDKVRKRLAAREWRDRMAVKLGRSLDGSARSRPSTRKYKVRKDCRNSTGVVGISENTKEVLNGTYYYFQVCWMEDFDGGRSHRQKTMSYKPDIEGDRDRVFKIAKRLRRKMVKLHYK